MVRVLANNANYNMTVTPRDSGGQPILGLGNINASRWIVTDGTNNFTVNSSTLLSDGVTDRYALSVTPSGLPTGTKDVVIKLDGLTVATAPTPLQYDFRPAYSGMFDTTGAEIAWDMTLDSASVKNIYDASGNNRTGAKYTPAAFNNTRFTAASTYKTSIGGSPITLGQAKIGALCSEMGGDLAGSNVGCGLYTGNDDLCSGIVYSNGLPINTLVGVFYKSSASILAGGLGLQYGWSKSGASGNEGFRVGISNINTINLYAITTGGLSTSVCSIALNTSSHLWDYATGILFVAVRVNSIDATGLANLTLFANAESASGNFQFGTSAVANVSHLKCVSGFGANTNASAVTADVYACFDFAAYSDIKSNAFLTQQRQAWGL